MDFLDPRLWEGRVFSGGWTETTIGYDVVEPATGTTLGRMGQATPDHVHSAVERAGEAQIEWARRSYHDRAVVLRRAAQLFLEHADEITRWTVRESGAAGPMASRAAAGGSEECYEAAALASVPYGEVLRSRQPRLSLSRRRPVGVVGVIAPFNAPLLLAIRSIAPALALGNAVVLKPDPRTAVCGGVVFARIFEEAGLPDGLFHVLPGGVDVGEALVRHPQVPVIAFTGSTVGGQAIARTAADLLKRVHLELGGNSALIILDDVDVEDASAAGAQGSFWHAGQICMATGRHLVHESLVEPYVAALAARARKARVGDPASPDVLIGPLIDQTQRDRVHDVVMRSVSAGATVVEGGSYDGLFYRPTVLTNLTTDSPAYAEEIFGPVAPIVPFSSLEQAAQLAADSPYGLSLGILTKDIANGLALADLIPSGLVHINDQTINDEPTVPFGGVGQSGTGARHGGHQANLDAFTDVQWLTIRGELPQYAF